MQLYPLKLITIVTEEVLKDQMIHKAQELGATGYTVYECQGKGVRGTRHDSVSGANVRIELVCPESVAVAILTTVSHDYFEHYACIAWISDVAVVRGARYVGKNP